MPRSVLCHNRLKSSLPELHQRSEEASFENCSPDIYDNKSIASFIGTSDPPKQSDSELPPLVKEGPGSRDSYNTRRTVSPQKHFTVGSPSAIRVLIVTVTTTGIHGVLDAKIDPNVPGRPNAISRKCR
jgi:hypothetical protein